MAKLKVIFTPSWEKANPYQSLLKKACEAQSCEVKLENYPSGFFPLNKLISKYPDTDILHLHWISELLIRLVWSRNSIIFWVKVQLFLLDCKIVKLRGVKIIWTIHNKLAHESQRKREELIVRRKLSREVNKIILHSTEALDEICKLYGLDIRDKAEVIFHGNYNGCYPAPSNARSIMRTSYNVKSKDTALIYFGSIKPYKGVESLIKKYKEVNPNDVKLFICGAPKNEAHKEELLAIIGNHSGIISHLDFLSDQELVDFIELSDAVILPYSDTLTSGSALLAMTQGKALIMPPQARVFGCVPDGGAIYFSEQENEDLHAHLRKLKLYDFDYMGKVNKEKSNELDWEIVGLKTKSLYQ